MSLVIFFFFLTVNKSYEKTKTNHELILLYYKYCVYPKPDISVSSELHCCPNTIKNSLVSHIVALDDITMNTHTVVYFTVDPTYIVLQPEILPTAQNLQLKIVPNKCTISSCLINVCSRPQRPDLSGNDLASFKK